MYSLHNLAVGQNQDALVDLPGRSFATWWTGRAPGFDQGSHVARVAGEGPNRQMLIAHKHWSTVSNSGCGQVFLAVFAMNV